MKLRENRLNVGGREEDFPSVNCVILCEEFPKGFTQKSISALADKHFAVWNRMLGNLLWRIVSHLRHPLEDAQEGLW